MSNLQIKLVKSPIGYTEDIRGTVRALGLKRMNQTVEHKDVPEIRGMVRKVVFLVEVTKS